MQYSQLCAVYEQLEKTTKRLEKTKIIAEFIENLNDIEKVMLLLQGIVYPIWDDRKLGFGAKYIIKAISKATGTGVEKVKDIWRETGDLGAAAERLIRKKTQATLSGSRLTVSKVFGNLQRLAGFEGRGSVDQKVGLVADLLTQATPTEARFITRTVLDELRVGTGEGILRDALVWAFLPKVVGINTEKGKGCKELEELNCDYIEGEKAREAYNLMVAKVQSALDYCNDYGRVAEILRTSGLKGLNDISITPGFPLKVMLALKEETIQEAFERVGRPAAIEHKLDGFRLQIHKYDGKVSLFTRRLENVTKQFPDVVKCTSAIKGKNYILDAEAVGFDKKKQVYRPFQLISQRIKRLYDIEATAKAMPVQLHIFDVLYHDGKNLISTDFIERRKVLKCIVKEQEDVMLTTELITDDEKEAEKFYKDALNKGVEGIMLKKLNAPYKPGSRVGYMVKMKPTMETLDLVIVGAEWGEGKRSKWLSSYTLACRDEGSLKVIGKVSTGLKEKNEEGLSFENLTEELRPLIKKQEGKKVTVEPKIVIEVAYEEIQKSPSYGSGFALRFPRVLRLRPDRDASSCSSMKDVLRLYKGQR